MSTGALDRLLDHLRWADEAVVAALRAAPEHAGALELLSHVVGAEETWLARLEGREPRAAVWPRLTLGETAELARTVHAGLADWIARTDAAALERDVAYTNSAGQPFTTRALDIVTHVMLHGSYHRGQIAMLLRQSGARPVPTDYIAFVRGAPAATRTAGA